MARLGELYAITSGGTPARKHPEYYKSGNIPWVKTGDLKNTYLSTTDEKITIDGLKNSSARLYPVGTVLLAMYGATIGATSILEIEAATNQACAAFTPRADIIPQYLCLFFESQKSKFIKDAVGGAQPNISAGYLRKIEIPLPSLDEQRKIAAVLDKVSDLIAKRRQQLTKLDELVKARFVEMFGTFPQNEHGWPAGKIRDVIQEARYGSSRPAVEDGKYPYLRMNNITYNGELDLRDIKHIDVPESELPKCTVQFGDVLFNRTNSKELVGKTCVYDRNETMVLAGFVIRIRVNSRVLPEFLSSFLNTDFTKQMLLGMCKTAIGQANINSQEMQNIGIYIPPIDLQHKFVEFKQQVNKSKSFISCSLDKLKMLKKVLMQRYFG